MSPDGTPLNMLSWLKKTVFVVNSLLY